MLEGIISSEYDREKYHEYRQEVVSALGLSSHFKLSVAEWMLLLQLFQYGESVEKGVKCIQDWRIK